MQDKVCKQQYQVMRIPPKSHLVLQINTHAFFLCTEFLKVLEKADLKEKMGEDTL